MEPFVHFYRHFVAHAEEVKGGHAPIGANLRCFPHETTRTLLTLHSSDHLGLCGSGGPATPASRIPDACGDADC